VIENLELLERHILAERSRRMWAKLEVASRRDKVREIITESDADRDRQMAALRAELGPDVFVIERRIVSPPADGQGVRHASS
jgi:hypothetical protein